MTDQRNRKSKDRVLGMDRPITRRDFLNGIAIGATAAASAPLFAAPLTDAGTPPLSGAAQDAFGYYPPLLTGMRGSHPGSFEGALMRSETAKPGRRPPIPAKNTI